MDGDTFKLTSGSDNVVVRLKDVDTPETSGYNTPDEFKGLDKDDWRCLERWGYRAKNFLEKKLEESTRLEYRKGVLTVEKGSYGRLLGRVYLNGSNQTLGELIVQRGYGRSYGEEYRVEEREARNNSRGLWQCGE
ncbi:MAG: thermonuclease family protein [Candidatus Nanohalobium sp.]